MTSYHLKNITLISLYMLLISLNYLKNITLYYSVNVKEKEVACNLQILKES